MPSIRMLGIRYALLQIAFCLAWTSAGQIKHSEIGVGRSAMTVDERRKIDDAIKSIYLEREKDPDTAIKKLEQIGERSMQTGYKYGFAKAGLAIANIIINQKPEDDIGQAFTIQRKIKNIIL
ncbi:MAG: hypothetical protein WC756_12995, partial [Taibaiella sp.]